jgi:hypothetical protein
MYWNKINEWFTRSSKNVSQPVRGADALAYVRAVPAGQPWVRRGVA